jgi:hypothetical protein
MKKKPNGDFLVKPGEIITVTVQASGTEYLASFSDLSFGNWVVVSPPNVQPNPDTEVRKFTALPVPANSFDIQFTFNTTDDSAKYHVTIVGVSGEDTFEEDVLPPPPPLPEGRDYTFVTS